MRFPYESSCFLLHNFLMRCAYEISCFLTLMRFHEISVWVFMRFETSFWDVMFYCVIRFPDEISCFWAVARFPYEISCFLSLKRFHETFLWAFMILRSLRDFLMRFDAFCSGVFVWDFLLKLHYKNKRHQKISVVDFLYFFQKAFPFVVHVFCCSIFSQDFLCWFHVFFNLYEVSVWDFYFQPLWNFLRFSGETSCFENNLTWRELMLLWLESSLGGSGRWSYVMR